ncbi:MFS transporter [Nocardia sp. NBC_01329]|uniref:MFS transporter n=1 Tax=Nocardia sp. NBC_01329 TaxID=2903594 RepID=UPI002E10A2C7|nr:MFS transporter [Nocardia sp. NBC_01329]
MGARRRATHPTNRRPTGEPAGPRPATATRLPPDFHRLWAAFTAGQIGSSIGAGALPLVAILLTGASDLQVSLMAALAGVGAAAIAIFGTTTTLIVDSLGHLISALGIRRIRTPEAIPARQGGSGSGLSEIRTGWTYIAAHSTLHRLFWNAMLFGGSLVLVTPLMALLMLRELGFPPWQYGLALGIPGVGGLLGAWCAPRLVARFGERAVLLGSGTLRTCWLAPLVLTGPGALGLTVVLAAETLLLFCAGVFNPMFAACRMNHTADDHMVRVGTAWSISAKCVQPVFIALGGVLAAATGVRVAIGVAAFALLTSSALLPWRARDLSPGPGGPLSGLDESRPDGIAGQRQPIT